MTNELPKQAADALFQSILPDSEIWKHAESFDAAENLPCSPYWELFQHMSQEFGMSLLESELSEIVDAVDRMRAGWERSRA